jgi:hypothetical protein
VEQRVHIRSGEWATAFGAARGASEFVQSGFVTEEPDGRHTFFGPDAEVLLEEAFQAGYCFSLGGWQRSRPNQIGLRFTPAGRQRGRVDIVGTLWLDTAARALRDVEFNYVGLDRAAQRFRPGGRVAFGEMPNGLTLIDQWSLRMVTAVVDTAQARLSRRRDPGQRREADATRSRAYYATEGGGELARATWPDGKSWQSTLGTLRLRVIDRNGAPVAGTRLQLDSTDYGATTDTAGNLEIVDLLPGPYKAIVIDSMLATIGIPLQEPYAFVAVRDSVIKKALVVRTTEDLVVSVCSDTGKNPTAHAVIARVVTPDGKPVERARWRSGRETGTSDAEGQFRFCVQAARGDAIELLVWRARGTLRVATSTMVRVVLAKKLNAIRIELSPKP